MVLETNRSLGYLGGRIRLGVACSEKRTGWGCMLGEKNEPWVTCLETRTSPPSRRLRRWVGGPGKRHRQHDRAVSLHDGRMLPSDGYAPYTTPDSMTGFVGGLTVALVGAGFALGFLAFIGIFHKAINIYRGAGLLTVLALMGSVALFSYRSIAEPSPASEWYLGIFVGLGFGSLALLTRAKSYVPPAMLPPPPPPTLGSTAHDPPLGPDDPFS